MGRLARSAGWMVGLLAWSDDLVEMIRRALDPHQVRILQTDMQGSTKGFNPSNVAPRAPARIGRMA